MRVLPPDGVAMAITAGGTALAAPSGISSVLTHPAPVKYSGDATSYQRVFVEGTSRIIVTAWIGPASSKDDRASLATVVGSIAGSSPGLGGLTPTHVTPALVSGSISYPPIVFPQVRDALKAHHILITGINATNLVIPPIIQAQALQRVLGPEANRYPLASATLVGFTDTVMRPVGSSGASGLTYNHKLAWLVISPNGGTDAIGTFNGKLQGPLLGTGVTFIDPINGKELLSTSVLTTATQTGVLGDGAVPVWRLTHDVNFGQFVGLFVPPESAQPATSASTILQETLGWYHPPAGAHLSLEFGDYEDGRQIGNLLGPRPVWVMDVTAACSAADPTSGPCPPEEVLILDAGSGHLLEALAFKH